MIIMLIMTQEKVSGPEQPCVFAVALAVYV